jgi:TonB-dependent SusC/RagA subfamily outer membrane receptor
MPRFSSLVLLPGGLVIGLLPGCAYTPGGRSTSGPPIQIVTVDELRRAPRGEPIEMVLMTRFPGVLVTRMQDGSVSVRIRGPASFMASGEPLYVIDGQPIQSGPWGALQGISPYDIAKIEVLQDPGDTAIFGIRGANGVIVITTRGSH